mmetsp:Transcript_30317/g.55913  ORF Transcript_30317/g.55913 Transcript_30317/m.55913 type:complete len:85 (+) Transcript_30317:197-451(+)
MDREGLDDGANDGRWDGLSEGLRVGITVGVTVGVTVGLSIVPLTPLGAKEWVGISVTGASVTGALVGESVGRLEMKGPHVGTLQ